DHRRPRPVRKAIEHARADQSLARGVRLVDRVELDLDEDLARVLPVAEELVAAGLAAGAGAVLVEHLLPQVVVADVQPREQVRHFSSSFRYSLSIMDNEVIARLNNVEGDVKRRTY